MLHAGGEGLGESFSTFLETAIVKVLAVVGESEEDVVEAMTDALGEELVQTEGHDGSVGLFIGGRAVKLVVVVMRKVAYNCYEARVVFWNKRGLLGSRE